MSGFDVSESAASFCIVERRDASGDYAAEVQDVIERALPTSVPMRAVVRRAWEMFERWDEEHQCCV